MSLPLSKCCDLADLPRFSFATRQLLRIPDLLENQHEARVWEYGIACEAIERWIRTNAADSPEPLEILDAGGATSNLWKALKAFTSAPITRVDPLLSDPTNDQTRTVCLDLATYRQHASFRTGIYDVLTCISVIEHIPEVAVWPFCQAAYDLLRPGGLLVLTTDYWDQEGPDTAHFHWMRERIYGPAALQGLREQLTVLGFEPFGEVEYAYPGPQVYDYSFASVVLTKGEA